MKSQLNYHIRNPKKEEAQAIIDYLYQVSGESDNLTFGQGEFEISVEKEMEFIEKSNSDPNQLFLIAEFDDAIIAMMTFKARERLRMKHYGEFGITVRKSYWGKGIGERLLKQLIDWAKAHEEIYKINLEVREDNAKAIQLYEKAGFKIEGKISRYMQIDNNFYAAFVMGLEID